MKRRLSNEQTKSRVDVRETYKEDDRRKQIDLKNVANRDSFRNMAKKRKVFNFLTAQSKTDSDATHLSRFLTSAEYACTWCKAEYGLTKERLSAFISVCDDIEESLIVLGDESKRINYLLSRHPNETCPFVENRMKRMLIINEKEYEAATPEKQSFSDYIVSRGFLSSLTIQKLVDQYIKTGARTTAIRSLIEDKLLTCRLHLSHDADMEQFRRVLDYYSSMRRHRLQQNDELKDGGEVKISTTFALRNDRLETEIAINYKDDCSITVALPDYGMRLFRNWSCVSDSMNSCFHTYRRVEQINSLIAVLRERYDVIADIDIPEEQKCYCLPKTPCPDVPDKNEVLPTTGERTVMYIQPSGLMKNCLNSIRDWDWRNRDVRTILPEKFVNYYFGSGNKYPHAKNGL